MPVVTSGGRGSIDESVLRQLIDDLGDDDVAQISAVFAADARRQSRAVLAAQESDDAEGAARAAHQLKSASGFVGAAALAGLCAEVDAVAQRHELHAARSLALRLAEEAERVADEITIAVAQLSRPVRP